MAPSPLRRLTAGLTVGLLTTGLLVGATTPADAATTRPTSVTLTPTADPAHSQTFTWRMTKQRPGQVVQVKAPNGRVSTTAALTTVSGPST